MLIHLFGLFKGVCVSAGPLVTHKSFVNLHFQLSDQLVPSSFEEGGSGLLLNSFLLLHQELHKQTKYTCKA